MAERIPAVFVSHGAPNTVLESDDYTQALRRFGESSPQPTAIVIISAHGESADSSVVIGANPLPELWYDFRGFQPELYQFKYPVKGDPALAIRIATQLTHAGLKAGIDPGNRLDHGVWVPLSLIYPGAEIPVVQIAMPRPGDPRQLYKIGQALASLRGEGVLLVGSGGATHNLRKLRWDQKQGPAEPQMKEFENWLVSAIRENRIEDLFTYESQPFAREAHPTWEHFHPLFFVLGARQPRDEFLPLYEGFQYGTLSLLSFALK